MCYKVSKALLSSVKQNIDVIYEMTKDGYVGSFNSMKSPALMKVLTEVVKCGALSKERKGKKFSYKWIAQSEPTERFYINIAGKIGSHQRELDIKKRSKGAPVETPVVEMPVDAPKTLSNATIAELWAEMQSRGVVIENNHLVIIKKEVIA